MKWKKSFDKDKEIILVTSSKDGSPLANIVASLGFDKNKIVMADCQMGLTRKNLEDNNKVCLISRDENYYRIKGTASIVTDGKLFDKAKTDEGDYKVKALILVDVEEVYDLDKQKKVKI